MTKNDSRWIAYLLARALTHTLLGAIVSALSGALCIGAAGTVTSWILRDPNFVTLGGIIGLAFGSGSGALVGVLSFAVIGFTAPPGRGILPPPRLLITVVLGQVAGTVSACMSFFSFVALSLHPKFGFAGAVNHHLMWIMWGAPIVMMCAQIAAIFMASSKENTSHYVVEQQF